MFAIAVDGTNIHPEAQVKNLGITIKSSIFQILTPTYWPTSISSNSLTDLESVCFLSIPIATISSLLKTETAS